MQCKRFIIKERYLRTEDPSSGKNYKVEVVRHDC